MLLFEKGIVHNLFCLWPLGLEIKHQFKMDAALWHSSLSQLGVFFWLSSKCSGAWRSHAVMFQRS